MKDLKKMLESDAITTIRKQLVYLSGGSDEIVHQLLEANKWKLKRTETVKDITTYTYTKDNRKIELEEQNEEYIY